MSATLANNDPRQELCTECDRYLLRTFERAEAELCMGHPSLPWHPSARRGPYAGL